jgi:hypothetical protein
LNETFLEAHSSLGLSLDGRKTGDDVNVTDADGNGGILREVVYA